MKKLLAGGLAGILLAGMLALSAGDSPAQAKKKVTVKKSHTWTVEEALAQLKLHPRDPYLQYLAVQLAGREGRDINAITREVENIVWRDNRRRGRWNNVDMFSIFSGALAVQESLQLDTMQGIRPNNRLRVNQNTRKLEDRRRMLVDVSTLTGPTIRSHPWEKMLAGRKPEIDPLARMVPADFYFVQFGSINKMLEALGSSSLWTSHIFSQVSKEAKTLNINDKIKSQLVIETNPYVKPFYDLVVEEVAVTGSDLFVQEGSDVTLVFRLKRQSVFQKQMDGFLTKAQKNANVKKTEGKYLGVDYTHLTTPDRSLHVYSAYPAKGIHVRSNSAAAFKRVLEAINGKTPDGKKVERLGDMTEFAFIRTIYPRGAQEEDGFIYLSDPFIRRLVGPQVKLTQRRRMLCYNHLRMIGNAAMLYRTENGKMADSLETLHKDRCTPYPFHTPRSAVAPAKLAKLITDLDSNSLVTRQQATVALQKLGASAEAVLRKELEKNPSLEMTVRIEELLLKVDRLCGCPSGGAYVLASDGMTGICTHHGQAHYMNPNIEVPVTKVRGNEADEYKAFLREYNSYWRTFFDPIAVRIQITPKRYRLETIVLPLINNSIYSGMARSLGGEPEDLDALPVPKRNIFSMALRIDKRSLYRQVSGIVGPQSIDELNRQLLRDLGLPAAANIDAMRFVDKGIGNQIGLHVYDSVPNFDFNLAQMIGESVSGNGLLGGNSDLWLSFLIASLNSPVYLSLPVQDAKIVDEFSGGMEKVFAVLARQPEARGWFRLSSDFYQVPFKADKTRMKKSFVLKLGPLKWRFFWARIGNGLYIASKDFILDDILAMETERAKSPEKFQAGNKETTGHALIRLRPQNWNQVLADYRLGWAENHREACINNHGPLSSVARAFTSTLGKIDEKELAQLGDRIHRQADQLHQVHYYCPEGGRYVLAPDGKTMTCSVHGSTLAPRQPAGPSSNSPLGKQLQHFAGLTVNLKFLEDGLHAVMTVDRK